MSGAVAAVLRLLVFEQAHFITMSRKRCSICWALTLVPVVVF